MVRDNQTYVLTQVTGSCFADISITTKFTFIDDTQDKIRADITFELQQPVSLLCSENIVIGTTFKDYYQHYFLKGAKTITLEFTETTHVIDLLTNGLFFFSFCIDQTSIMSSTLQTASLFTGGLGSSKFVPFIGSKIPKYMSKANIDFIERFMQMEMEERVITEVQIDPKAIKDGDLLLARRLDGIDPFVMVATG